MDRRKKARPARRVRHALQLRIDGPRVRSGKIAIPDLLILCEHVQAAIGRQAEALIARRQTSPAGPKHPTFDSECLLELVDLASGSTTLTFHQSAAQAPVPTPNLGDDAIAGVIGTINDLSRGESRSADAGVLTSLAAMGRLFMKRGITSIKWTAPAIPGRRKKHIAEFTPGVYRRIARTLKSATTESVVIDGRLEMADFKPSDRRCRIHPTLGPPIACTFGVEHEESVYRLLRQVVRIRGVAMVNSQTGKNESVRIDEIASRDPLPANAGSFFNGPSIEELARVQGVGPITDFSVLAGGWPDDEDVEEFIADTYRNRK
jgi:hypothetical protein